MGSTGCVDLLSEQELTSQEDLTLDPIGLSPKRVSLEEKSTPTLSSLLEVESTNNVLRMPSSSSSSSSVTVGNANGNDE